MVLAELAVLSEEVVEIALPVLDVEDAGVLLLHVPDHLLHLEEYPVQVVLQPAVGLLQTLLHLPSLLPHLVQQRLEHPTYLALLLLLHFLHLLLVALNFQHPPIHGYLLFLVLEHSVSQLAGENLLSLLRRVHLVVLVNPMHYALQTHVAALAGMAVIFSRLLARVSRTALTGGTGAIHEYHADYINQPQPPAL